MRLRHRRRTDRCEGARVEHSDAQEQEQLALGWTRCGRVDAARSTWMLWRICCVSRRRGQQGRARDLRALDDRLQSGSSLVQVRSSTPRLDVLDAARRGARAVRSRRRTGRSWGGSRRCESTPIRMTTGAGAKTPAERPRGGRRRRPGRIRKAFESQAESRGRLQLPTDCRGRRSTFARAWTWASRAGKRSAVVLGRTDKSKIQPWPPIDSSSPISRMHQLPGSDTTAIGASGR